MCRTCQRWNLTPLEERWEAVETCEKLFRGTRIRTSSENIGLARHPEGLELVRIGKPLRPEFAAWRYGDQFGRRRRRSFAHLTGLSAAFAAYGLMGTAGSLVGLLGMNVLIFRNLWQHLGRSVRFRPSDGWPRRMNRMNALHTRIRPDSSDAGFLVGVSRGVFRARETEWFAGEDARRAINAILPAVNVEGGSSKTVQSAVSEIESHGHPERFVHQAVQRWREYRRGGTSGHLVRMPHRLAFEMALHEEEERRALEGELWKLEQAWREAEEIAAIADDLLLPEGASGFVDQHRP